MSITDELREFTPEIEGYKLMRPRDEKELLSIADRIDKAHEEELAKLKAENATLQILSLTSLRVICNNCVLLYSSACSTCLVEDALSKLRDQLKKEE